MMKKIYNTPATKVVKIATVQMLAASEPEVKVNPEKDPIEPANVDARKSYDVWEEEEED